MNYTRPPLAILIEPIKKAFLDAKSRDVRLRYLTEITKDNIDYCKVLTTIVDDLRHLDGIKGNFMISETEYLAPLVLYEKGKIASQVIYSNAEEIVEQQQYIFDTLWRKAIPAEQKIREIEEGIEPEIIETIRDPVETQMLGFELVKSATYEILVIFSTANAFHRQERAGTMELFKEAAAGRRVQIRILTPIDDLIKGTVQKLIREQQQQNQPRIDIRFIGRFSQTKIRILVVDKASSLVVELKDDTKESSFEAMGLATYSNSKSTVLSYVSIFETLWMQTELYEQLVESNNGLAKAYEQLEAANEQLKVHEKMQKEFINVASHELRTPIQPILGLSEVLYAKIKDTEQRQLLDTITRNAKRLQRLTNDILDVTKIESQSLKLNKERFNLSDLISSIIDDYRNRIERDNIAVKLLYEPNNKDNIFVEADRGRLIQVISNLLDNAIKFTKEGTISIITEEKDSKVIVSVKDTGTGIDPEILPRLFSKFVTKSERGGTGLGLFICKNIVEAHGGKIWVESNDIYKEKGGATFSFSLPIMKQQPINVEQIDK
jgi:signal transduction histidine kinase